MTKTIRLEIPGQGIVAVPITEEMIDAGCDEFEKWAWQTGGDDQDMVMAVFAAMLTRCDPRIVPSTDAA